MLQSELILFPYQTQNETDLAFLTGSYELLTTFKNEHPIYRVEPIYDDSLEFNRVAFNSMSLHVGFFLMTSVVLPVFVNWLSAKINRRNNNLNTSIHISHVNINIIVHDKGDDFATSFNHNDSLEEFQTTYKQTIGEYAVAKSAGKLSQFDAKHIGKRIDFTA